MRTVLLSEVIIRKENNKVRSKSKDRLFQMVSNLVYGWGTSPFLSLRTIRVFMSYVTLISDLRPIWLCVYVTVL